MSVRPNQMVNRAALAKLLAIWQVTEPIPRPGNDLVIAFPPGNDIRVIRVGTTDKKDANGRVLFSLSYSNERLQPVYP